MVAEWDAKWFDRAWDIHVAKNMEKWPVESDDQQTDHPRPAAATILDHEQPFWSAFIVNGNLDAEKLSAAGYSGPQAPWIAAEMRKLGWI